MAEALHITKASANFASFTGSRREGPRRGHRSSFPAIALPRSLMLSSAESIAPKLLYQDGVTRAAKHNQSVPLSVVAQAVGLSGGSGGDGIREVANGKASDFAGKSRLYMQERFTFLMHF